MYLDLFGNCNNDLDVNITSFKIHIWARNLLILLIQEQKFEIAQDFFVFYFESLNSFTYNILIDWIRFKKFDMGFIRLYNLAINAERDPLYETKYKKLSLIDPHEFNNYMYIPVLKYTTIQIDEETGQKIEMDYNFPLVIYRIQDLKKIRAIIFEKEYYKINYINSRNRDNHVPGTKTDLQMYDENYLENKKPNFVIQISLQTIRDTRGGKTKKRKIKVLKKKKRKTKKYKK